MVGKAILTIVGLYFAYAIVTVIVFFARLARLGGKRQIPITERSQSGGSRDKS